MEHCREGQINLQLIHLNQVTLFRHLSHLFIKIKRNKVELPYSTSYHLILNTSRLRLKPLIYV